MFMITIYFEKKEKILQLIRRVYFFEDCFSSTLNILNVI